MRKKHYLVVTIGLFFSSTFAQTTIYESVAPDGSVLFSDMPSKNGRAMSLSNVRLDNYTMSVSNTNSSIGTNSNSVAPTAPLNYVLNIASPADQTTFQNQLPIDIVVKVQPALQKGDQIQLVVDGVPYGQPQSGLNFSLDKLVRGKHQVEVKIVSVSANVATPISSPITIYKQQASLDINNF